MTSISDHLIFASTVFFWKLSTINEETILVPVTFQVFLALGFHIKRTVSKCCVLNLSIETSSLKLGTTKTLRTLKSHPHFSHIVYGKGGGGGLRLISTSCPQIYWKKIIVVDSFIILKIYDVIWIFFKLTFCYHHIALWIYFCSARNYCLQMYCKFCMGRKLWIIQSFT